MIIDQKTLDVLTSHAKASARLRQNLDLRNSIKDGSQRMLNAIEPGTVMPIHRHRSSSETVVCIRGHFVEEFYDQDGHLTETIDMVPGGNVINIPKGQWHSLKSLESGTVLLECKNGKFKELEAKDILQVAPAPARPLSPFKIHFLPVKYGDSFLIECCKGDNKGIVLVDGGPKGCGEMLLEKVKETGTPDLLVLTHYDDDHIGGLTQYIQSFQYTPDVPAKAVWANCAGYLKVPVLTGTRSAGQGAALSWFLNDFADTCKMTWRDDLIEGVSQEFPFASIEVVSPTAEFRKLAVGKQETAAPSVKPIVLAKRSLARPVDEINTPLEELAKQVPKAPGKSSDSEVANAASIAFILRSDGLSLLMLGDCYPQNVEAYLRSKGYSEENPLKLDYVKVAHHGSLHNTSNSLLDVIQCNHFIISTNGEKFGHPDRACIAHILCHSKRNRNEKVHLYFNTDLDTIAANTAVAGKLPIPQKPFLNPDEPEKYNFEVHESVTEITK